MRNKNLFFKIARQIESEPETYDQQDWGSPCGTAHCVAGWAASLSGYVPAEITGIEPNWAHVSKNRGRNLLTSELAQTLLGLNAGEANHLFDADWKPHGATPADAMRFYGRGGDII